MLGVGVPNDDSSTFKLSSSSSALLSNKGDVDDDDNTKNNTVTDSSIFNSLNESRKQVVKLNVYHLTPVVTGIYHTGVQIDDKEYNYGSLEVPRTGIYIKRPRGAPFYYKETITMGETDIDPLDIQDIVYEMSKEWYGNEYSLTERNCNHFSNALCLRLLGIPIPEWINRPARTLSKLSNISNLLRVSRNPDGDGKPIKETFPFLAQPDHTGYMAKRGNYRKNWLRRFFVLKGKFLWYFQSETPSVVTGCVPLAGCKLMVQPNVGTHSFTIDSEKRRSFWLSAFEDDEMEEWMEKIQKNIDSDWVNTDAEKEAKAYLKKYRPELIETKIQDSYPCLLKPERQGNLIKEGGNWKTWKMRWFVLKDSYLWYFKTEMATSPLGIVFLKGRQVVSCSKKPLCIELKGEKSNDRSYYIQASSEDELEHWGSALQNACTCECAASDANIMAMKELQRLTDD